MTFDTFGGSTSRSASLGEPLKVPFQTVTLTVIVFAIAELRFRVALARIDIMMCYLYVLMYEDHGEYC